MGFLWFLPVPLGSLFTTGGYRIDGLRAYPTGGKRGVCIELFHVLGYDIMPIVFNECAKQIGANIVYLVNRIYDHLKLRLL